MHYAALALAIAFEVAATLLLKASDGLSQWRYAAGSIGCYAAAGLLLSVVLQHMSVGIAYSVWAGAGIALICLASALLWGQRLDAPALLGIALIVSGVALITLKSAVVLQ
jgi:small multidrug resistance pump